MTDPSTTLHRGERNRVWFRRGDTDPTGPYEVAFVNSSTSTATAWAPATTDTHPEGGPGLFVWARNGTVPGADPTGTVVLTRGLYSCRVRHVDGALADITPLDFLEVE